MTTTRKRPAMVPTSPAEARRIMALLAEGKTTLEVAHESGRSPATVHAVKKNPEKFQLTFAERNRKGARISRTRRELDKDSLRASAKPPASPVAPYGPQVADSQITFSFAIALLEKATEIVRVLSTQQHPPELMKLVSDTIQAGVDLAVANREAERLEAERLVEEEAERIRKEATAPYPLGGYVWHPQNHTDQIAPPHLVNQYGQDIDE